mmetsp:Transcript_14742/g.40771  ORF Transcript_14742/g.40771 Transcript_14742/m.40771 type:complete len:114 (-) Transcript_14742:999-1340(-)
MPSRSMGLSDCARNHAYFQSRLRFSLHDTIQKRHPFDEEGLWSVSNLFDHHLTCVPAADVRIAYQVLRIPCRIQYRVDTERQPRKLKMKVRLKGLRLYDRFRVMGMGWGSTTS